MPEKSDPIAHNDKQNLLVCHILHITTSGRSRTFLSGANSTLPIILQFCLPQKNGMKIKEFGRGGGGGGSPLDSQPLTSSVVENTMF